MQRGVTVDCSPWGVYDPQREELQAINEHGSKGLSFLQLVPSELDNALKELVESPSRGH